MALRVFLASQVKRIQKTRNILRRLITDFPYLDLSGSNFVYEDLNFSVEFAVYLIFFCFSVFFVLSVIWFTTKY